tara:strand:- start:264 stop:1550 length:1287 start_codon:yes stop_codon:yes gene_type:complete
MNNQEKNSDIEIMPKRIGFSFKKIMILAISVMLFISLMVIMVIKYRSQPVVKEEEKQSQMITKAKKTTPETVINQMHQYSEKGGSLNRYHRLYERRIKFKPEEEKKEARPTKANHSSSEDGADADLRARERREKFLNEIASSPITVENNVQIESHNIKTMPEKSENYEQMFNKGMMDAAKHMQKSDYNALNQQDEKKAFLKKSDNKSDFYLDSSLQKPVSPYEVKAGTIIPALFETGINSDLPGTITARVSRNIYDTVSGNYLLIPQGTKVLGHYDSQIAYGQERVLMAWSRLIFPNGDSFDLQGQPGVDLAGMSGITDKVNHHTFRVFGSSLMFSLFGAAGQLSQPKNETNQFPSNGQIIFGAIGQQLTQTGAQLVMKNMDIQPTIEIRPGAKFNILLTKDMVLPGAYPKKVKEITVWQTSSYMGTK